LRTIFPNFQGSEPVRVTQGYSNRLEVSELLVLCTAQTSRKSVLHFLAHFSPFLTKVESGKVADRPERQGFHS
jgi:hypothetical protein